MVHGKEGTTIYDGACGVLLAEKAVESSKIEIKWTLARWARDWDRVPLLAVDE